MQTSVDLVVSPAGRPYVAAPEDEDGAYRVTWGSDDGASGLCIRLDREELRRLVAAAALALVEEPEDYS